MMRALFFFFSNVLSQDCARGDTVIGNRNMCPSKMQSRAYCIVQRLSKKAQAVKMQRCYTESLREDTAWTSPQQENNQQRWSKVEANVRRGSEERQQRKQSEPWEHRRAHCSSMTGCQLLLLLSFCLCVEGEQRRNQGGGKKTTSGPGWRSGLLISRANGTAGDKWSAPSS